MEEQLKTYKCPGCGSSLVFDAETGNLVCRSCDSEFDISVLNRVEEQDSEEAGFDWTEYKEQFKTGSEQLANTVVYVCKYCGASIETDGKTAASKCPYCDNDIVMTDQLKGGLKPNLIIPFKVDSKGLKEAVDEYIKGKKLLPKNFFNESKLSKIQGVYVPFWLFDAKIAGDVDFNTTRTAHWSDDDYDYTETSHYKVVIDGEIAFEKVPVDGSSKMDNDLMDAMEPYDYSELVEFKDAYLSGFLADRFDEDPDTCIPRASGRMNRYALNRFRSVVNEYDTVTVHSNHLGIESAGVKYALLPVYLMNFEYNSQKYRFAVNGQTGKMVGELPVCKNKVRKYFLKAFSIVFAIAMVITYIIL